jgi:trimeric autotransporter adhesin
MKKIILVSFIVFIAIQLPAQSISIQTVNSTGYSSSNGNIFLEWSVGEMTAINTLATGNAVLTQGVLQPAAIPVSLPVELLSFTGQLKDQYVELKWKTAQEVNAAWFEVERSADGSHFAYRGKLSAAGNSSYERDYLFNDTGLPEGRLFYRLKQIDVDGNSAYSNIISLDNNMLSGVTVYPNPVTSLLKIRLPVGSSAGKLVLLDVTGRLVRQLFFTTNTDHEMDISNLATGIYYLHVQYPAGAFTRKIIKQ